MEKETHSMNLIMTSVVDIATLAATCRALRTIPPDGAATMRKRLRSRLRTQLRRALRAYIGVLAGSRAGSVDAALLAACRLAAEQRMPDAMERQAELDRVMATEAGALDGLPAARQDLWRLAHLTLCARVEEDKGLAARAPAEDADAAKKAAKALRRPLRRALVAYCRALQRGDMQTRPMIERGRAAALRALALLPEPPDSLDLPDAGAGASIPASISRMVEGVRLDWEAGPKLAASLRTAS
jgi:hypothetical protein